MKLFLFNVLLAMAFFAIFAGIAALLGFTG